MRLECVADLIGIRTSAVERAMEVQEVILGAIDGQVKWDPSRRRAGGFRALPLVDFPVSKTGVSHSSHTNPIRSKSLHLDIFGPFPHLGRIILKL